MPKKMVCLGVCDKFVGKLLTPPPDFPKTPPIGR